MRKTILAAAAALMLTTGPVLAAEQDDVERLAREGAEKFIEALETLIERLPRYDMPEVTDDGDIIIRRRDPETAPHPGGQGDDEVERI
ncbi:MAG: hypothetical protein HOK81_08555 [Rhodospirillaceae bacterium]|jgi:hypothetical protein|nr:hypothetical protein [Rhodospirillaceae bacterium]